MYLPLNLFHYHKFTGSRALASNSRLRQGGGRRAINKESQIDEGLLTPDKHPKTLMKVNYPKIKTIMLYYLQDETDVGMNIFKPVPPKTYFPDGYCKEKGLILEFDEDLKFHSDNTNKHYMCKTAAYSSKLLEGYSLARFAYDGKLFSITKNKDEKEKNYNLIDKVVLQIIESISCLSFS
jgi:hypothetical protein